MSLRQFARTIADVWQPNDESCYETPLSTDSRCLSPADFLKLTRCLTTAELHRTTRVLVIVFSELD